VIKNINHLSIFKLISQFLRQVNIYESIFSNFFHKRKVVFKFVLLKAVTLNFFFQLLNSFFLLSIFCLKFFQLYFVTFSYNIYLCVIVKFYLVSDSCSFIESFYKVFCRNKRLLRSNILGLRIIKTVGRSCYSYFLVFLKLKIFKIFSTRFYMFLKNFL
jgi:hypothetical protein